MPNAEPSDQSERLVLELRRGTLVLATLSQLQSPKYGYRLVQDLTGSGLEVEQGTLYPLLRRLDEQGLLDSTWNVDGSRPRKYYRLSLAGQTVLAALENHWNDLVGVMTRLLTESEGEADGTD